jgi:hypothetical protein
VLETTISLPGIDGDFDHFAYDLKRNRLIAAAEEHHTLELFDLKSGKRPSIAEEGVGPAKP